MRSRHRALAILLALVSLLATPLAAQSLGGRLTAGGLGGPVSEALVALVDSSGRELARTAASPSGGFFLQAPAPGTYRVRVYRIGHSSWTSAPLQLAGGMSSQTFEVPPVPVTLPELVVRSKDAPCRARGSADAAAAVLIEEARKAFALAERGLEDRTLAFRTVTYSARLGPNGEVTERNEIGDVALRDWPVRSAPAESIREHGFVSGSPTSAALELPGGQGPVYYGLDGALLFSSWFLESHCFRASAGDSADAHLARVDFEPSERVKRADVAGTLWLDRSTLALSSIEYRYVGLESWVPDGSAGGGLAFVRLPRGGWVVQSWRMRAPVPKTGLEIRRTRLHGFVESGGRVTEVRQGNDVIVPSRDVRLALGRGAQSAPDTLTAVPLLLLRAALAPDGRGSRLELENGGAAPVTVTEVRLAECTNLATRCGVHRVEIVLGPGASAPILEILPRAEGSYTATVALTATHPAPRPLRQ